MFIKTHLFLKNTQQLLDYNHLLWTKKIAGGQGSAESNRTSELQIRQTHEF